MHISLKNYSPSWAYASYNPHIQSKPGKTYLHENYHMTVFVRYVRIFVMEDMKHNLRDIFHI